MQLKVNKKNISGTQLRATFGNDLLTAKEKKDIFNQVYPKFDKEIFANIVNTTKKAEAARKSKETTKNQQCPVCEHNSTLWNSGIEANKDVVRKQKRKLNYVANVYIVSDPKHPENEGKVKLFRFGKKIFDKITEAMNPQFEDESPINPFDMWKGANFKLKIRKVEGYQNYDKSEFDSPTALLDDDAALEKIWKSEFSLNELTAGKEFKSYDELKQRLDKVLGLNGEVVAPKTTVETIKEQVRTAPKSVEPKIHEDDDDMSYFAKLAEED